MAGYSRQSAASIVPTAVVRATPLNDEFNTLRDAFVVATGHKHDGTSTEGAYVPLISDTNSRNKVVVDSANNRISLFINVSSAAVEQLRLIDGAILPVTDNDIDLGSSTFEFKDLFIDGTANIDSLVADTAAISGGTINSAVIGGTTPAAGTFTTITATVSATIPSVAITGGTINNTIIGATTPAAGTFTNLTVNTAATIASAAISAGTINNTVIGGTTPQAVTGTTITANTGFVGALTGNVTGNVTASSGTSTFNNATVNGTLSATLTGNVNASSGTSTFNNVTISGTLNMDGATAATITNLSSPVNNSDAATKLYVDTSISNLVNSAPGTLDTLNELATALGNDPSFATTVTNSIATKLSLSGGTMTGAIAMGTNKITGMGDPTSAQDAATKTYVDTQRDTRLALSGGTMSGAIAMGTNKITGLGDPTSNQDAATKIYVDGILGSATSAAASAAAAATSASNAATSASNASTSATNAASSASAAAASAAAAAASYDSFDDRYLGVKTSDPSLDNDGNALVTGAIYFNSTAGEMRVWTGSAWASTLLTTGAQTFTGVKTFASNPILDAGTVNGVAYLNGSKVLTTGSALSFDGTSLTTPRVLLSGSTPLFSAGNVGFMLRSTDNFLYGMSGSGGFVMLDNSQNTMSIQTPTYHLWNISNTEQMRLTSTGLGIGTSSPLSKLTVAANNASAGNEQFFITGTANTQQLRIGYNTTSNYGAIQAVQIGTGYRDLVLNADGGNVGIGTSSPTQKLTVNGNIETQNAGYVRSVGTGSDTAGVGPNIGVNSSAAIYYIQQLNASNGLDFWYYNAGWNKRLTLDSSGNLGLGVTPSASWDSIFKAIQIGSASYLSIAAQTTATARGSILWNAVGSGDESFVYRNTGDPANRFMVGSGFYAWYTAPSGTAGNAISFTQAMTLDASGNLGIGTSSPTQRLSVAAASALVDITSTTGTSFNGLELKNTSGSFYIGQDNSAGSFYGSNSAYARSLYATGAYPMVFFTNGTERLRIDSSGNLGLGVTPGGWTTYSALELGKNGGGYIGNTASGGFIGIGNNFYFNGSYRYANNAPASFYYQQSGNHYWNNAVGAASGTAFTFTQAMTLSAGGNLLVGTTTQAASSAGRIVSAEASGGGIQIAHNNSGGGALYVALGGGGVATYTYTGAVGSESYTERARITSGGNVSIGGTADRGTTVGTAALQLFNGTAPAGTLTNGVSLYSSSGDLRFMDAAGNASLVGYRGIPQSGSAKTTSYTLATTDVGEFIQISTGGSIVIPNSTFAAGDVVSLFNNTSGTITITCSTTNAYIAGTDTNKASMTLATRGVATILFVTSTLCVVSGNVT